MRVPIKRTSHYISLQLKRFQHSWNSEGRGGRYCVKGRGGRYCVRGGGGRCCVKGGGGRYCVKGGGRRYCVKGGEGGTV